MSLIYSIDMLRNMQLHICVKIENRTVKFAWQVIIGNMRSSCQKKEMVFYERSLQHMLWCGILLG